MCYNVANITVQKARLVAEESHLAPTDIQVKKKLATVHSALV